MKRLRGVWRYTIPQQQRLIAISARIGQPKGSLSGDSLKTLLEEVEESNENFVFYHRLMIGGMFGVITMCLLQASRLHEWKEENDVSEIKAKAIRRKNAGVCCGISRQ